jgi:hypothetical protein
MKKIRLRDGSFCNHAKGISFGQETAADSLTYFEWDTAIYPSKVCFFTDICFHEAPDDPSDHKIALFLEPRVVAPNGYKFIEENSDVFDYILTFYTDMVDNDKYLYVPRGGTWLKEWSVGDKSRMVSVLSTQKYGARSYEMRHKIAAWFWQHPQDVFGEKYHATIRDAYESYRYSVVVLNERSDMWFTERLIDCFALGTVPILWGCPSIGSVFNPDGIIQFETLSELPRIIEEISEWDYKKRLPAINDNHWRAYEYRRTEDLIWNNHRFLFELGE